MHSHHVFVVPGNDRLKNLDLQTLRHRMVSINLFHFANFAFISLGSNFTFGCCQKIISRTLLPTVFFNTFLKVKYVKRRNIFV